MSSTPTVNRVRYRPLVCACHTPANVTLESGPIYWLRNFRPKLEPGVNRFARPFPPPSPRPNTLPILRIDRRSVNRSRSVPADAFGAALFAPAGVDTAGRPNASPGPAGRVDTRGPDTVFRTACDGPTVVRYLRAIVPSPRSGRPCSIFHPQTAKRVSPPPRVRLGSDRPRSAGRWADGAVAAASDHPAQSAVHFFFHKLHFRRRPANTRPVRGFTRQNNISFSRPSLHELYGAGLLGTPSRPTTNFPRVVHLPAPQRYTYSRWVDVGGGLLRSRAQRFFPTNGSFRSTSL